MKAMSMNSTYAIVSSSGLTSPDPPVRQVTHQGGDPASPRWGGPERPFPVRFFGTSVCRTGYLFNCYRTTNINVVKLLRKGYREIGHESGEERKKGAPKRPLEG